MKSRNLIIDDFDELYGYLKRNNYQKLINGYNDPFMENFDRNKNKYDFNSSSKSIIQLFEYDKKLKYNILNGTQEIETEFSNKISHFISAKLKKLNVNSNILGVDETIFKKIFSSKCNKKYILDLMSKYVDHKEKLFSKYKNKEDEILFEYIPIWLLSIKWSFGDLIKIFECLNKELQYKIINSYSGLNINIPEFIFIFDCFRNIRNKAAHSNVIYNVEFIIDPEMKDSLKIKNKIFLKMFNNLDNINIYEIFLLIDIFLGNKNNCLFLKNISDITQTDIINSVLIPNESKEYILYQIGYRI